eukprot:jgi/Botrbrau1/11105/Bobra.0219s0014.1
MAYEKQSFKVLCTLYGGLRLNGKRHPPIGCPIRQLAVLLQLDTRKPEVVRKVNEINKLEGTNGTTIRCSKRHSRRWHCGDDQGPLHFEIAVCFTGDFQTTSEGSPGSDSQTSYLTPRFSVEETMRARDELLFNKPAALESQNDALEKTMKSPNALLFGVEESIGEAQLTEVKHLFGAVRIEETRRLGKFDPKAKRPRPVLIRFVSIADKHAAFKKSKVLRQNFKITMDDDLTTKQRGGRAALLPTALALRNEGWTTFWRGDILFKVKGQGPPIKVIPGQQASTSSSIPMNIT